MKRPYVEFRGKTPEQSTIMMFADSIDYIRAIEGNPDGCTVGCGGIIHGFLQVSYKQMVDIIKEALMNA